MAALSRHRGPRRRRIATRRANRRGPPRRKTLLALNSSSCCRKARVFGADGTRRNLRYESVREPREAFDQLLSDLGADLPVAVGHRRVHGGDISEPARLVDAHERARLQAPIRLAPLHLPGNLLGTDLCQERFAVPQVACFDTAIHATMPERSKRLAVAEELGLRRFGFRGLNDAHIASVLPGRLGPAAKAKVVAADEEAMIRELCSDCLGQGAGA